ncbi:NAD(P)/FAD-dependent oxidoreductase [Neorhizobium galegae]|uniref:NAD(P)/FAD-dependent oxidoreductase n=1 Tax=Neorhizobium galegae TaxID=399 RepID=UPI0020362C96|nr:FAD-dependent oxidoreductase [Neorhizobium galegae]MCM2498752.1 FAD-dependent oxidoreductase [Neorhizobium galegae]
MTNFTQAVVVGSGQAAFQLIASLRGGGYDGIIRMIGDEPHLPYQRPPLSKAFLRGDVTAEDLAFGTSTFFEENCVDVIQDRAVAIDRLDGKVELSNGDLVGFDRLILSTGARCRHIPDSADVDGILSLRTLTDAALLRERLIAAGSITIIGGGFLGLEVASICTELGIPVRVVELMPRLMSRNASEVVSSCFYRNLAARGVTFEMGLSHLRLRQEDGHVVGIDTDRGYIPTNLILSCIGVIPNDALAVDAGLAASNGIVVDEMLTTADPRISAIGDCASHPNRYFGGMVRLESVQNAVDQAIRVAGNLIGEHQPYDSLPWFWSEQAGMKLQIAGRTFGNATSTITHGAPDEDAFSVFHFDTDRLVGVESVSRPKDHMLARKLLRSGQHVTQEDLKRLLAPQTALA